MTKTMLIEYTPVDSASEADEVLADAMHALVTSLSPWRKRLGCRGTASVFRSLAATFAALAAYAETHVD